MKAGKVLMLVAVLLQSFMVLTFAQKASLEINQNKELQVFGKTNWCYQVQSCTNLISRNWQSQGTYFAVSNSPHTQTINTNTDSAFFRAIALNAANNQSYSDTCAEHDNVNVPFMGYSVTSFWVIATHPTNYIVDSWNCNPNFNNCSSGSDTNYYLGSYKLYKISCSLNGYSAWMNCYGGDTFWRPQGMSIAMNGNWLSGATNMTRIDVGRQIGTGINEYPGYFVLYSDGYIRLIPFPPVGHSSVCFGSSVIIGPAVISSRPYADIESVDIRTTNNTFFVTYRGGGTATITLSETTREKAIVKVAVNYSLTNSFCTFRSMFVADGNSDCDHVQWKDINGVIDTSPIMSFSVTAGTDWFFYRRATSIQRQSAPDIRIVLP